MIFVISDTHVPKRMSRLPSEFIQKIREDDLIIHAGDFTDLKVCLELERLAPLYAVSGNMDVPEIKEILPFKRTFEISGFKIGLIHGYGPPFDLVQRIMEEFRESLDLIIFGHTHSPYSQKQGGTLFFNPGSLSGNISGEGGSYGIFYLEEGNIRTELVPLSL